MNRLFVRMSLGQVCRAGIRAAQRLAEASPKERRFPRVRERGVEIAFGDFPLCQQA